MLEDLRRDFEKEVLFYQKYHRHPWNRAIHAAMVPIEWATWMTAVTLVLGQHVTIAISVVCGLYYWALKPISLIHVVAAFTQPTLGYLGCCMAETENGWLYAAVVHVSSWLLQVGVGHSLIEKNKPAMTTELTPHSVVLSPLLAWC